jgi:uncharacterized protein YndB with AHSA1/START domain
MAESIEVSGVVPAAPERVYEAWLDADQHGAMTGAGATVDGDSFTAWDDYISGTTLAREPGRHIVQSWRTTEFPDASPDSRLEVLLEPAARGTRVTFRHSAIPDGQGSSYEQGWKEFYLEPMKKHFAAAKKRAPRKAAPRARAKRKTRS